MFPIGARTIDRELARTADLQVGWVGQVIQVLYYFITGMFFKQRKYAKHPLRHMGNIRVKC